MFTYYYFGVFAGLFGLIVGSFLNVVIYRLPAGLSVVRPRSRCPACETPIAAWDNVPVVSWLVLRGRCRHCGVSISARYTLVELLTCAIALAVYWQLVPALDLHHLEPALDAGTVLTAPAAIPWPTLAAWLYYTVFFAGLIAVFFIDLDHFIVPNEITYLLIPVGLVGGAGLWWAGAPVPHPLQLLLGVLIGGGGLLLIGLLGAWVFRKEAMGMGDVKLLATIGAFLGAWPTLVVILLLSALAGSLAGIVMRVMGRAHQGVPDDPRDLAEAETATDHGSRSTATDDGQRSTATATATEHGARSTATDDGQRSTATDHGEPITNPDHDHDHDHDPDHDPDHDHEAPPAGYYIPYGPFLVGAAFVHFMVGDLLIDLYRSTLY